TTKLKSQRSQRSQNAAYENANAEDQPRGTKERPASTCRELTLDHPHLEDGFYYVDPNHGSPFDALQVFCNFTAGGQTCVSPVQSQFVGTRRVTTGNTSQRFSEVQSDSRVEYSQLDVVQLRFLRLHSDSVTQTLVVSRSAAPLLTAADLHFLGDSGSEIRFSDAAERRNGCEVQIRFSGKGEKMNLLPIRDLRLSEAEKQQETNFRAEIGPLCFL
ncbi:hypothetical protein PGIGA_G00240490, partial [Pangasianodon gigas]|nr:hypothetical protein [Pangasianodon gigas]